MNQPKYKIVYNEMSCYNWGFSINDVWRSGEDFSEGEVNECIKRLEEDDELIDYLLLKLKEGIKDGTSSFKDLVECFQTDDTEYSERSCDDCGHSGYKQTWNI